MTGVNELIYIMSPSYSGSTLLTCLLARHPAICTVGELKATNLGDIDRYCCSCGQLLRNCRFWAELGERLAMRDIEFEPGSFATHFADSAAMVDRLLRGGVRGPVLEAARLVGLRCLPRARRTLARVVERNRALIDAIAAVQRRPVFLDASKDPIRLSHMLAAGHWNIRVIHLIRDGRATAHSFTKHNNVSIRVAAGEWQRTQQECHRMLARLKAGSWLQVRYEDLCRATAAVLDDIFRFLELPTPPKLDDEQTRSEMHILGNQMRLLDDKQIRVDERWRQSLDYADLMEFEVVAGELNRRLGYQ